jgi:hypothetical protein
VSERPFYSPGPIRPNPFARTHAPGRVPSACESSCRVTPLR